MKYINKIVGELITKEKYRFIDGGIIHEVVEDTLQIVNDDLPENKKKFSSVKNTILTNIILESKPTKHAGLNYVLLVVLRQERIEFTTHIHDTEKDCIDSGYYFDSLLEAVNHFNKRGE